MKKVFALVAFAGVALMTTAAFADGRFEYFKGTDGQSRFRLVGGNGKIVLQSEGYKDPRNAVNGARSVTSNGLWLRSYQTKQAANGQWYFVVTAANNKVVGCTETYVTKSNAVRAIADTMDILERIAKDPKHHGL